MFSGTWSNPVITKPIGTMNPPVHVLTGMLTGKVKAIRHLLIVQGLWYAVLYTLWICIILGF